MLWPEEVQDELLKNSPTLKECRARRAALQQEWDVISQRIATGDARRFSGGDAETLDYIRVPWVGRYK